ncbi:MAG: hypothetical protein WDO18_13105 [Acidobacteriota bacterium]
MMSPAEKCNGLINTGVSQQHNAGFSGQLTWLTKLAANKNQFTGGGAWDRSAVTFISNTQLGYLNPDRTVTPIQSFADGVNGGDEDGEPFDTRVNLKGVIRTGSLYFTDTLTLGSVWNVTVSGRYNRTTVDNRDQIRPPARVPSAASTRLTALIPPLASRSIPGRCLTSMRAIANRIVPHIH